MSANQAQQERFETLLKRGELIESTSEMTPEYLRELKHTLVVSGDTELISAPAYYLATQRAPSINAYMTGISIIQDELAHAHIAYHLLEELGDDQEKLIFDRKPESFRYPYAFDVPLESWTELIVANLFYDQAGFCLLGDIHEHCSYGPWKRGLNKVMLEENFHLRNGRTWAKRMSQAGGDARDELQRAVDWMFPLTVEWFGLPDDLKSRSTTPSRACSTPRPSAGSSTIRAPGTTSSSAGAPGGRGTRRWSRCSRRSFTSSAGRTRPPDMNERLL